MALDKKQLRALSAKKYDDEDDEDILDAAFPAPLSSEQWKIAVGVVKKTMSCIEKLVLADGAVWVEEETLRSERRRRRPLADFGVEVIPILMQNNGTGWYPEYRLWYLAHQQLGLKRPAALPCGVIENSQLRDEFKEKLRSSIKLAKPFVEPLEIDNEVAQNYMRDPAAPGATEALQRALERAPRPQAPQRHVSAESLQDACENLLSLIEPYEKPGSTISNGSLFFLLARAFEAGKAHAYLERDKDPQTLNENIKGSEMIGTPMTPERRAMEEGVDGFEVIHRRLPTSRELQKHLGVVITKNQRGDGKGDRFQFGKVKINRHTWQRRFDEIKRDRKSGRG